MAFDLVGDIHFDLSDIVLLLVVLVILYMVLASTGMMRWGY